MLKLPIPTQTWASFCVYFPLIILLSFLFSETIVAQKVTSATKVITGRVTGDKGEPLTGVSVEQKGSYKSTITEENGAFSLTISDTSKVLVFSFIGRELREVAIAGKI